MICKTGEIHSKFFLKAVHQVPAVQIWFGQGEGREVQPPRPEEDRRDERDSSAQSRKRNPERKCSTN